MMSPLRVSIAFATSALLVGGCDDGIRAEAAPPVQESRRWRATSARGGQQPRPAIAKRDSQAVIESSGMLESSGGSGSSAASESPGMRNASNVSSPTVSSAEGYIGPSCASPAREDQQRCLWATSRSRTWCSTATIRR